MPCLVVSGTLAGQAAATAASFNFLFLLTPSCWRSSSQANGGIQLAQVGDQATGPGALHLRIYFTVNGRRIKRGGHSELYSVPIAEKVKVVRKLE